MDSGTASSSYWPLPTTLEVAHHFKVVAWRPRKSDASRSQGAYYHTTCLDGNGDAIVNRGRPVTIPRRQDTQDPDLTAVSFKQDSDDIQGVTFNQTLGYGFVRNSTLRAWAGPTVRLNVDWYGAATDIDVVDVAIGGGPELGINYHLNDALSISGSLSYGYFYLAEHFDTIGDDEKIEGSQHILALTISILWRNESDRWGK